jgi:hypothetical protein
MRRLRRRMAMRTGWSSGRRRMGEAKYNYLLKNVYLLPVDAEQVVMLGRVELARYRALEALLPDPSLADPNPTRSKLIPKDQQEFLRAYESREAEMIQFLHDRNLVNFPPYLGKFMIRQLPDACFHSLDHRSASRICSDDK